MQRTTPHSILALFLLVLSLVSVATICSLDAVSRPNDNRTPAARPPLPRSWAELKSFPGEYQAYFNDSFGLRNSLILGNYLVSAGALGVSPTSDVVAGREGWLFYHRDGELDDCRGITRFDEKRLSRWAAAFTLKKKWLAARGIRYLVVIAPNKSTIYPEFLPAGYGRVRECSALDDLVGYLRKQTDLDLVDLRPALLANKKEHRLYLRTDTHWNSYGAFLGYQEIMRPLSCWFPAVKPRGPAAFSVTVKGCPAGDLANLMGGGEVLSDEQYDFVPRERTGVVMTEKNLRSRDPFTLANPQPGLPRALVFCDSFFYSLVPFFSPHFRVSRYLYQRWNSDTPIGEMVASYRPDVVVEEVVERWVKKDNGEFTLAAAPYAGSVPPAAGMKRGVATR